MIRQHGESTTQRGSELFLRATCALACSGPPKDGFAVANSTPLFVGQSQEVANKRKVRDREDALASTRDACAPQNLRCNAW